VSLRARPAETPQEEFWRGRFGDAYTSRNKGPDLIASNLALFAKVLARTSGIRSVIEFGANIGLNLAALRQLLPGADLSAVEINRKAVAALGRLEGVTVYPMSMLDFSPDRPRDLVLTKGVLIHVAPDRLPVAYEILHRTTSRYICIAEYYNRTPVSVPYRGHQDRLFKRDFGGEMLARFEDLELIDYGFAYHRARAYAQDDLTWFLMEKRPPESGRRLSRC
jgi:spore coat polysaccharide biosynthesis protein SpsF